MGRLGRADRLMTITAVVARAIAAAVTMLASSACATTAPLTSPGPPAEVPPGTRYVAIGSSFASGAGVEPLADESCFRSENNYPGRVAATLRLTLVDVSCAGATTDNLSVQLESVTEDTGLVTLTIGGNDAGYSPSLEVYACLETDQCEGMSVDEDEVERSLGGVADRLVTVLDTIQEEAPAAEVLLVTYPRIVPEAGDTCPNMPFTAEQAEFTRNVGAGLDDAFRDAAQRSGAHLVDVYSKSPERGMCEPDTPWVGGLPPGTAVSGQFPFHPTADGTDATAELVLGTLTSS